MAVDLDDGNRARSRIARTIGFVMKQVDRADARQRIQSRLSISTASCRHNHKTYRCSQVRSSFGKTNALNIAAETHSRPTVRC
jgi:hypothetical protein